MKNNYFKAFALIVFMLSVLTTYSQTRIQQEQITSRYDKSQLQQLQSQFSQKISIEKQKALQMARTKNWPVTIEEEGRFMELQRVTDDGRPIYYTTFNVNAARSTRTDHLNSGGSLGLSLDGQNMIGYVWDGGHARVTHQEYDGPGGTNRVTLQDTGSEGGTQLNFHAAHVTGTIMASGVQASAKGMAWHAQVYGYMWNNDLSEATTAASNGMLLSNHSYGFRSDLVPDYYFGAYIGESRDWDNLMYNAPMYLMVVAAGNDGNTNYNGSPLDGNSAYDKLTGHSTSKNNLVVANGQDANVDASGNLISVTISGSSSEGPTDDYRIKPDITGNGTSVTSTYEGSDTEYGTISGTSMASPNVMGSLLLLQQHANDLNGSFMRAATLKGLALHTADDAGPTGPDAVYGWGLLNAKRAAEAISNNGNESQISELTLSSGQTYQIDVESDGVNELIASISWTDPAGTATTATNSTTPRLVNDLDIRVSQGATTYTPWRLTGVNSNGLGDNVVDPYERIEVAGASGSYTITVTHKGSLSGGSQNYTLILTGLSSTPVVCNATVPTNLSVDGFGDTTASISWDPVPGASYDLRYREAGGSWIVNSVNGSSTTLTGLTPETSYEVQVRSKCPDTTTSAYSASVNFTTTEIQLNYCASASTNINDEYIGRVQLNTIDNASGGQFYTDFTNISTDLNEGQNYTITVTPTWTGTVYAEGYAVWIDFNKDGDFADPGEQVWTQAATTATPVSGNFTVPTGTAGGNTRMRVSMKYNGVPTACETFTYGEVEDYTVNLIGSGPDTEAPVITLTGPSTVNIEQGGTYNEQGATATDNVDGDITANIVIAGDTVDTNVVGTYIITYNVSDAAGNAATEVTRTVNVTPDVTAPVITLNGASVIDLLVGDTYNEQGATATDNFDGDISANIVIGGDTVNTNLEGTYIVTFNVSDAAGNSATEVTRTVNVNPNVDTTPPVITLIGASTINLLVGDTYVEQGATATDETDGDISANIVIGGDVVDTNTAGTYSVTYNVSDAAGNAATEVTRTVIVENGPTCDDGIQNGDETGVDCGGSNCAPCTTVTLNEGYFETGLDGWTEGGNDCARVQSGNSFEGLFSIRIRDNSGAASSMTSPTFDLSNYEEIEVSFYYYAVSMENNEDFWLQFNNGSGWVTVSTYVSGQDFSNGTYNFVSETITGALFGFTSNSRIRIVCDASGNNDQVYVDQVITIGTLSGPPDAEAPTAPANLIATNTTESTTDLSWDPSTDNVGVTGYDVYQDGVNIGNSATTSFAVTGLNQGTTYSFYVIARDAAGNSSGQSNTVNVTTNVDTEAPTAPTNLVASNTTANSTNLSWNASTDNVGVTDYDVYQDGFLIGNVTGTSYQATGLTPLTTYSFYVIANDASDNSSAQSNTVNVTTEAVSPEEVIHQGFFETGWDGWTDGGTDCARYSGANSYEGSFSIRLRDNSGTASAMTLSNVDVSSYDTVEVEFYFYPNSMENGEDFWLRFYDGSTWQTVATYVAGSSFTNGSFYVANVSLDAGTYNFATNSGFRFQNDASANNDQIYIDQVTITGITNGGASENTITSVGFGYTTNSGGTGNGLDEDLLIYPNPVKGNLLTVKLMYQAEATYRIINMIGQTVASGALKDNQVDVGNLLSGVYFIEVDDGEEVVIKRFIRQ